MDKEQIVALLQQVKENTCSLEEAAQRLAALPYEDIGYAKLDHHRELRCGFPEVVYCASKTPQQVAEIMSRLAANSHHNILATRANAATYAAVAARLPQVYYDEDAQVIILWQDETPPCGNVLVLSAGTSDLPVAKEAALTAQAMGAQVESLYDVGVAGLHRILAVQDKITAARVIIVVAGMEGALASVVGGLAGKPVIACPTSVGYGASFGGLAALLAMLNSCAAGVTVVNIDNGFGAGFAAALINRSAVPEITSKE